MRQQNNSPLTMDDFDKEIAFRRYVKIPTKILHLLIRGDREVVRQGVRWRLDHKRGMIDQRIIKNSCYEPDEIKYFFTEAAQRNCEIFLDVGANIGLYSMLGARMGLFREIHAIEPIKEHFERLQWHIHANGFDDLIHPYQVAVSDSAREVLFSNVKVGTFDAWSITETQPTPGEITSELSRKEQTTTLDSLFNLENKDLAIKMDIEWHELPALCGAQNLLKKNNVFLQVEITDPDNTQVSDYLLAHGFRMLTHMKQNFYFDNAQKAS